MADRRFAGVDYVFQVTERLVCKTFLWLFLLCLHDELSFYHYNKRRMDGSPTLFPEAAILDKSGCNGTYSITHMETAAIILKITGIFALFGLVHSLCVRDKIKSMVQGIAGEPFMKAFYRLLYTLFSAVTTLVAFGFIYSLPDTPLFEAPLWLRLPMRLLQLSGLFLALRAFRVLDFMEFTGTRQALRFITGRELIGDREGLTLARLVTHGAYGIVRHPLYVAGLLIFTFNPDLTCNRLVVSVLADIYFVYGALSEEKRLISHFGTEYVQYMKKVPRFMPRLRKPAG